MFRKGDPSNVALLVLMGMIGLGGFYLSSLLPESGITGASTAAQSAVCTDWSGLCAGGVLALFATIGIFTFMAYKTSRRLQAQH
jgi:hypothetical protein